MKPVTTPNFASRTLWTGDNLDVLRGMNSECVDLIYLDPPFNSNRNYAAPIGSKAAGAAFKDTWTLSDLDVAWMGLIADVHPAVYKVIDTAGTDPRQGYAVLPLHDGCPTPRNAADTEGCWQHLSALRPNSRALFETVNGLHFRGGEFQG